MRCLVTGAAGFIGSHLSEELIRRGHEVRGVDAFIPYYPHSFKERNVAWLRQQRGFELRQLDLRSDDLDGLLEGVEIVFHIAAMAGLMKSWTDFDGYWTCNVQATQRLLEAWRHEGQHVRRLLLASTSSVYGKYAIGSEDMPTRPVSPYGVTKLAAEHLCRAYLDNFGAPIVILRYFSIYGPRQRPDMGYYRFIEALLRDQEIIVYGDGQQVRGNTYISDCIEATLLAVEARPGEVFNVGGGETATVWDILRRLERLSGRSFRVRQEPERPGDQRYTFADTSRLKQQFGWQPKVGLDEGLARQWVWQQSMIG
ncbi:MAG: nucleotide sugar epimerase [Gemmataceae bacterium]